MIFIPYNLEYQLIKKVSPWRTISYAEANEYIEHSIEYLFLITGRADRIGQFGSLRVSERKWVVTNASILCLVDIFNTSDGDVQEQLEDAMNRLEKENDITWATFVCDYIPDQLPEHPPF